MDLFLQRLGKWVITHRWGIILAAVLMVGVAASGGRYLTFNNDSRVFFSKENPQLKALEALENTYTKDENALFAIAPKNGNVFTRETLAAVESLTESCWKIPYSSRVDSITNFQHTRAEEDDLIVEDLVSNANELTDKDIQQIKQIALSEPLLVNRLISSSGHVTGINILMIKPDGKDIAFEVATFIREMARDFRQKHPDIDIHLTGGIMIDTAFGEATINDLSTLVPLMYLVLIIIMGFALRSITGTLSTLIVILFSMFTGLGLAGWLNISMTSPSANAPTVILTLAVADSIHLLVTVFQQMRQGKTKHEAIVESLRVNFQPVFLTSLTTAIGFLTMNFSDAPPFRDLGNIVAIGITAAFIFSVFLLPALIAVLPVRVSSGKEKDRHESCGRLADFVVNRRHSLFWIMLFATVLMTLGVFNIKLDDDFVQYFDKRYDFRVASDFVQENLTGLHLIEYSLDSGETGGINDPEFLKTTEKFASWFSNQPNVIHVNTITDIIKRLNKNMHQDDPSYYRIPDERDLAAQYLLLYEMSLPFGLDLNNQINVEKSSFRMSVTLVNATSSELRKLDDQAREWLASNAPKSMFTYGTGLSVMFAHLSERNIKSMLGASFGALVLISTILTIALRSLKLGVISLIPNLAPAFMAFGAWGISVGQVGVAMSVMVALTLGIVVDDTVHFMSKYLRAQKEHNMESPEAVRYAFNTVGTAILVTTLILVTGFMVLSFSGFKVNSEMGLMTAITIFLAMVLDFFFLPTLLMKAEGKTDEKTDVDYDPYFTPDAVSCKGSKS